MKKPNILLILLDGCRADRLGCYGYKVRPTSPNLDKLAKDGFVALNHYSTSNCTMPAVVSMMTGLYPCVHKASSTFSYYDGKYPFLTEILQENGYYTFGITNNLAAMSPEWGFVRGYDRYYRIGKHNNWFKESKEEQRGAIKSSLDIRIKRGIIRMLNSFIPSLSKFLIQRSRLKYYRSTDMGGRKAVENFSQALQERDKSKPFFGYINLPDTHAPYLPPVPEIEKISRRVFEANLDPLKFIDSQITLNSAQIDQLNFGYDLCVSYSDSLLGNIIEKLKSLHLYEETLIIITSDHGGMLYEKNRLIGGKYFGFEEEIKSLFIAINSHKKGQTNKITSATDLFPTILNFIGIKIPKNIHGIDLFSDKFHESIVVDSPSLAPYLIGDSSYLKIHNGFFRSLITKSLLKIIYLDKEIKYIFNLTNDPKEESNLKCQYDGHSLRNEILEKYVFLSGNINFDLNQYIHNEIGQALKSIPPIEEINLKFNSTSITYT